MAGAAPRPGTASGGFVAKALTAAAPSAGFFVMVTGQIESAHIADRDNLYCDFTFTRGPDWTKMDGLESGLSQISKKSTTGGGAVVWNMPFDIIYKTTNVFGWPRLVVSVYGFDIFGRNVIVGYGSTLVPTSPGRYRRTIRLFRPVSSTLIQSFIAWLTANEPEFWDPRIVSQGRGREVTRVKSAGTVSVSFNVLTRGMASHGFTTGAETDSLPSDVPFASLGAAPAAAGPAAGGGLGLAGYASMASFGGTGGVSASGLYPGGLGTAGGGVGVGMSDLGAPRVGASGVGSLSTRLMRSGPIGGSTLRPGSSHDRASPSATELAGATEFKESEPITLGAKIGGGGSGGGGGGGGGGGATAEAGVAPSAADAAGDGIAYGSRHTVGAGGEAPGFVRPRPTGVGYGARAGGAGGGLDRFNA